MQDKGSFKIKELLSKNRQHDGSRAETKNETPDEKITN